MKKIKELKDYKEGDNVYLIKEEPGGFGVRTMHILSIKENKKGLYWNLNGQDIGGNWTQIEDNRIQHQSSGAERLVYDDYDQAIEIHDKKLREVKVDPSTIFHVKDNPEDLKQEENVK